MSPLTQRLRLLACSLVILPGLTLSPGTPVHLRPASSISLPAAHLQFGLGNEPGDLAWMTSSGVPWTYRYAYLTSGVNTGHGWETWNSPAGEYATLYMDDSKAHGYIPVFTYYEIQVSNPAIGADEADRDYSNLNNATTMNAYYANFALLMQKAAAFGQLVVVHVEPDLFAYMEHKAGAGDASNVSASVASSGYPGLSALPNTFQGYAWALLKLRDTIAPNVALALHASTWATGTDIGLNTDPSFNMAANADKVAAFLGSAGLASNPYASTFDLVFNDVADHDAGYSGHWWDRYDTSLPDFRQWLTWMTELHARTGRQLVVWQVPVGNQYYRTMNQTRGHYQDNRAEYFLSHVSDLQAAGIVAVLFGKANDGQTVYTDFMADAITNPSPISTFECNQCNTQVSSWSDDDGGYLRVFVGRYYQAIAVPPCVSGSVTAGVGSPQAFGAPVTFTAAAGGCAGTPEFEYWIYGRGGWKMVRPYSTNPSWTLDYAQMAGPGTYSVDVWMRNQGSFSQYETFGLMAWVVGGCNFASTGNSGGSTYTTTAGGVACSSPEYRVWMVGKGLPWTVERDWSTNPSFDASTVSGLGAGTYSVDVWVRQQGVSSNPGYYETWGLATYVKGSAACAATAPTLMASPASPQSTGLAAPVSLNATGCGASAQYEYWLYPGMSGGWQLLRGWGAGAYSWNAAGLKAGTYSVVAWARQAGSTTPDYDSYGLYSYGLGGCAVATLSADKTSPQPATTTINLTASGQGCSSPEYSYYVLAPGGTWQNPQAYSSTATLPWTPSGPGTYSVVVWVRQHGGPTPSGAFETYAMLSMSVT